MDNLQIGIMEGRKTTSIQQLELLLSFMEGHKNFAVGQVRSREGRATSARLWEQCAEILNAEGVTRTPKDWSKFWNDYKCRVRTKVSEINRGFRATGGGPSRVPVLTPLEERVAALLGRDVGPLTGVRQDPEIQIEYINNTVEIDVEQEVTLRASNSPVLDLHLTQENAVAPVNISPDVSRTATLETPAESQLRDTQEAGNNQPASQGSTPTTGRPRTRQPAQNRLRRGAARPRYVHQSNTAALDEARATIARIEEMRARTDVTMATASLNISSALTSMAESMSSMTEILRVYLSRITNLKQLEAETKSLNNIYIEEEDDDCSIFKRLTRKCTCLNQEQYNDLMIHFNEDTKYVTTPVGEVIKNIRIVKKFLYMGGTYSKNALVFLNEGFDKSAYTERVEITQGCSHADVCNVFENPSLVTVCISWPQKYTNFVDNFTQNLAASFLCKLARLEEGRRYLKYTTKITNDIKRILRKGGLKLDEDLVQKLTATLNLIVPPMAQGVNITYCCRHNDEDKMKESINALHQFRQYLTLEEVIMYLDLLTNFSHVGTSKTDLTTYLPHLLRLFKQMLKEYDNSEINIIITNILNNIVSNLKNNNNMLKENKSDGIIAMKVADTATEPVEMLSEIIQVTRTPINSKKTFSKFRQASRRKVSEFSEPSFLNRSKKFGKGIGPSLIKVPVKKKMQLKKEPILKPDHT